MRLALLIVAALAFGITLVACGTASAQGQRHKPSAKDAVIKTDAEWKKILTPEQYNILRQQGTEEAFTGKLWNNHANGIYVCAACGQELFSSKTKFESGTGWPSFWAPIKKTAIDTSSDTSIGM